MRLFSGSTLTAVCLAVILSGPAQSVNADTASEKPASSERIRIVSEQFVLGESGKPFKPWGFNYLGDFGRIIEEYWEEDWPRVEKDFREMRKLGANVVRLHLQMGTYMKTPQEVDAAELERLSRILDLAEENDLYLDLTGLGCYHLANVPPWYDELAEADRWQVQAVFWAAVAKTCAGHPAVFCYDLMNEPVITKAKKGEHPWLLGELEGMYFVQRISNQPGERTTKAIAEAWTKKLVAAIRKHDTEHLITVGVIPWAQVFPGAQPVFYSPEVARHLDFVSVHFYPKTGEVEKTVDALAVYDIGKPLVVEEVFPLSCSLDELDQFIKQTDDRVDGWISHYFGHTIEEHRKGAEPAGESVAKFLEYWQAKAQDEVEIPLIDDNDFKRGFVVWSPKPGMKRETGRITPLSGQGEPVWGIAQWHSRFDLASANTEPDKMRYADEAKSIEFDFSDPDGSTITLGLDGLTEYDGKAPERGAAWPHLLVERTLLAHPSLSELAAVPFRISYRLIQEEWHRPEGWDANRHTAQFVFYITVQNQNPQSAGFRDLLWFGVPIYDTRYRQMPQRGAVDFSTKHKKGTGKFIFHPPSDVFTKEEVQDGNWITIESDLLPYMKEALRMAWEQGYLKDSHDLQDYHLGSMNFGWEVPGTMDVSMQVKGLSLKAAR